MTKSAKLIFVSDDNHNKYYDMTCDGDTIQVSFGRVGATCQRASYPASKWDSLLRSKIKKGYKEVTHLFVEPANDNSVSFLDISDCAVAELIRKLEGYTKRQVSNNYLVTADKVTQKQIEEAQRLLNEIAEVSNNKDLNRLLLEVFAVIPRKMRKVQDFLYEGKVDAGIIEKVVSQEQELLDSMGQQVKQSQLAVANTSDKMTLLDAMGLTVAQVDLTTENMIRKKLHDLDTNYIRAYRVTNNKTQSRFDSYVQKAAHKKTDLFFHGSRNENWLPILQSGLLLRPTGAAITGKMFGYGTYYADRARKSWGYTSATGSYWARGNSPEAFLALFQVHLGNPLRVSRHESWCNSLTESKLRERGRFDSVFAEKGYDLRNNEYIVYTEDQSTIQYLIQMKG